MPKLHEGLTAKLLKLPVGKSCVVGATKLNFKAARRQAPGAAWRSETVEGGVVVTRVR